MAVRSDVGYPKSDIGYPKSDIGDHVERKVDGTTRQCGQISEYRVSDIGYQAFDTQALDIRHQARGIRHQNMQHQRDEEAIPSDNGRAARWLGLTATGSYEAIVG